jgi:kinesin family protein 5
MGPDIDDAQQKGLIPRLVESIFSRIAQSPDYIEFRLKLSFIEIYMEKLRDLIDVNRTDLKIR